MPGVMNFIAMCCGYLSLAILFLFAAIVGATMLAKKVEDLLATRAFHAHARRTAGVDNPLRHTDVTDLDGQLRRLFDQEAGQ